MRRSMPRSWADLRLADETVASRKAHGGSLRAETTTMAALKTGTAMGNTGPVNGERNARDRQILTEVNQEMGAFVYAYLAGERPESDHLSTWTLYRFEIQQYHPSLVAYLDQAEAAIM